MPNDEDLRVRHRYYSVKMINALIPRLTELEYTIFIQATA
jgi:hypothetical protein